MAVAVGRLALPAYIAMPHALTDRELLSLATTHEERGSARLTAAERSCTIQAAGTLRAPRPGSQWTKRASARRVEAVQNCGEGGSVPERRVPDLRLLEGGVFSACSPVALTSQDLLAELSEQQADLFHLYMICLRPRVRIVPSRCHADENTLVLGFTIDTQEGQPEDWHAEVTNIWMDPTLVVESEAPFTHFHLSGRSGVGFRQHVAWWLSQMKFVAENADEQPELFDLEVQYIGQAYGDQGSRTARDRLIKHSTLQAVYAAVNKEAPHMEVGIVLLGMENPVQAVRMTLGTPSPPSEDALVDEFVRLMTASPSFGQRLNFTEAALIRYFRPRFNDKFKTTFPSSSHTSYDECYELDLNSVGFTIDGRTLFGRLWSGSVPPAWLHMKTFLLHSPDERRDMFSFARA